MTESPVIKRTSMTVTCLCPLAIFYDAASDRAASRIIVVVASSTPGSRTGPDKDISAPSMQEVVGNTVHAEQPHDARRILEALEARARQQYVSATAQR